jgi:hypothetical protein
MMLAREYRMSKRRVMAKAKVYGFSPWVDQVDSINQIMKVTGERNESALLRKLVDEALDARRKKSQSTPLTANSDNAGVRLDTIESLLMRLVCEGDVSFHVEDVCLRFYRTYLRKLMRLGGSYGSPWSCLNSAVRGFMWMNWKVDLRYRGTKRGAMRMV